MTGCMNLCDVVCVFKDKGNAGEEGMKEKGLGGERGGRKSGRGRGRLGGGWEEGRMKVPC